MSYDARFGLNFAITPMVRRLLIANTVVFAITLMVGQRFVVEWFAFQPTNVVFRPWGPLTYMFLHGDLGHLRVLEDRVLHLDRRDVLATGDDHVLLAVGDGDVVGGIDAAAVPGVEEPVPDRLGGRLGLLPVALHDHVASGKDLSIG